MANRSDTQHHWHTLSVDEVAQRLETNQGAGLGCFDWAACKNGSLLVALCESNTVPTDYEYRLLVNL